ncbi:MAG: hypothetical protein GSR74_00595 [Desulfurococcales archaeon]|nr:hypothetical protein [Desulfurococcales archaeon]
MSWRAYEKIALASSPLRIEVVVDDILVSAVWGLHEYCGTEVLIYARMPREPEIAADGEKGSRITYYVVAASPGDDLVVPRQKASAAEVEVLEPPPSARDYAVIHTHPPGVKRFSGTDREYININHPVSLLIESGSVVDAVVTFSQGPLVLQVRPSVILARPGEAEVRYTSPAGKIARLILTLPSRLIGKLISDAYQRALRGQASNIQGCRRGSAHRS